VEAAPVSSPAFVIVRASRCIGIVLLGASRAPRVHKPIAFD
jgi:hypothetical protein